MTVSSSAPALPIAAASDASSGSASSGGCQNSSSGGDFASLLAGNGGTHSGSTKNDDSGSSLGQNSTATQNADGEEETTDEVPTPAEQISLAALLYAPQLAPLPKPTPTGDAICVSNPAQASTAFSLGNQSLPLSSGAQPAEGESTNPVLANLELPTTPVATTGFQVPMPPAPAADSATAPLTNLPLPAQTPAASPTPTTTPAFTTTAEVPTATVPSVPVTEDPQATSPAPEAVTPASSGAIPLDPAMVANVPASEKSLPTESVEMPELEAASAGITSANSAATGTTETPAQANSTKTTTAANTDGRLLSEQPIAQQTPRGTASAKAVHDMKSSTATSTDSSPESTLRPVTLDKGAQDDTSADQQDSGSAENSATQQTGAETFSVSTSIHAAKSEATSKAAPTAPMTPTAVVKEVNQGLERIQQSGNDRMDLRLSLEGGGEVSIALQVRDGAVHASFQTNSPEMREALQKNWAQMAARSESLAIPLAEPTFKSSTNSSGNFFQQQDPRERRQEASQEQGQGNQRAASYENVSAQPSKRVATATAPVRRASSGLNLYA